MTVSMVYWRYESSQQTCADVLLHLLLLEVVEYTRLCMYLLLQYLRTTILGIAGYYTNTGTQKTCRLRIEEECEWIDR